jgi:diacylglycerol kinase family enzyme
MREKAGARVLLIHNRQATNFSDSKQQIIEYALKSKYQLESLPLSDRSLGTLQNSEADLVIAAGGDGTMQAVARQLVGRRQPLLPLPCGATNVFARNLGLGNDPLEVVGDLLSGRLKRKTVRLGQVNRRPFLVAAGVGLDALVVNQVEKRQALKTRLGNPYFALVTVEVLLRQFIKNPPSIEVEVDGEYYQGVTLLVQNGACFSYLAETPLSISANADGLLSAALLTKVTIPGAISLGRALLGGNRKKLVSHNDVLIFNGLQSIKAQITPATLAEADGEPFSPVTELTFSLSEKELTVKAP